MQNNYQEIKDLNPYFNFLVRPHPDGGSKIVARYGLKRTQAVFHTHADAYGLVFNISWIFAQDIHARLCVWHDV